MFLHLGNTRIVFHREIIGIFKIDFRENPTNKQYLEKALSKRYLGKRDFGQYKSFLVTDDDYIHFSPLAPTTLARRGYSAR